MEKEIWKDIEGYNGCYQVSNFGNVFVRESYVQAWGGAQRKKPRILKSADNGHGYRYVTISVKNKRKNHYVHILVAKAFIPNPEEKPCVNHKNGNKKDNSVGNLEWCTYGENQAHAIKTGLVRKGSEKVNAIKLYDFNNKRTYGTIREAANILNINYGTLKCGLRQKKVFRGLSYYHNMMTA